MNLVKSYINNKLKYYRTCNLEFQINPRLFHEFVRRKFGVFSSILLYTSKNRYNLDGVYVTFDQKRNVILYNYHNSHQNSVIAHESLNWNNISSIEHLLIPYHSLDVL